MDKLKAKRLAVQAEMDRLWARLNEPRFREIIELAARDDASANRLAASSIGGKYLRMLAQTCLAEINFRDADSKIT